MREARIQTASGTSTAVAVHRRARSGGAGGEVGAAGVAEVADPAHRRVTAVARDLLLEHREDVVADRARTRPSGAAARSATRRRRSARRRRRPATPSTDRLPDQGRAPPPSSQNIRSLEAAASRKASTSALTGSRPRGSSRPAGRRGRSAPTPGGTARPASGSVRCATPMHDSVVATGGHLAGHPAPRRPRASGSAPRRTATGSRRTARVPSWVTGATSPCAGSTAATTPPYADDEPLHPQAHAEDRRRARQQERPADREVRRRRRGARARARARRGVNAGEVVERDLVVLDDRRQRRRSPRPRGARGSRCRSRSGRRRPRLVPRRPAQGEQQVEDQVPQQREAVLGQDRLGVELHPAEVRPATPCGCRRWPGRSPRVTPSGSGDGGPADEGVVEPDDLLAARRRAATRDCVPWKTMSL